LPSVIVYDVELTLSLPQQLTYTSGINAIAHCVEGLYSTQINPVIEGIALSGIHGMVTALRKLRESPNDIKARGDATCGAWGAGICLGHVGMGLHHKICHTLGGSFGLPHSEVHTVILPHAIAYNEHAAAEAMAKIRRTLGTEKSVARTMWDLEKELGTVQTLKELGMKEEDLEKAADIASQAQYPNPAPLEQDKLLKLLRDAYHGTAPV
jgi:alcohol dehydrogenase class IV